MLLRTSAMTGVTIDPTGQTARVQAGTLWLDVVEAAAELGFATLHGSSPDVGVVGYSLGGGMGWYARQLGRAANSLPAWSLVRLHMDPEGPTPTASSTGMLAGLPEPAIETFLSLTGPGSQSSLLLAELRQLAGALGRPAEGAGALPMLDGQFLLFGGAIAATPEMGARGHPDAVALTDALSPYATGSHYLNFSEHPVPVGKSFPAETWLQLKGIRSAVDPDGVFQANHEVPRLFENGSVTA